MCVSVLPVVKEASDSALLESAPHLYSPDGASKQGEDVVSLAAQNVLMVRGTIVASAVLHQEF